MWAAAPVMVLSCTTGILGLLEGDPKSLRQFWPTVIALAICLSAIGLQLVPLPSSLVERLSPNREVAQFERLLARADQRDPDAVKLYPEGAPRPLSIAPRRTLLGLAFATALSILLAGTFVGFSSVGIIAIARWAAGLGTLVAILGIYQVSIRSVSVFGFYEPPGPALAWESAPFVNRNHQAGYLVMVFSLTLGAFAGEVSRGLKGIAPRWRDRVLWFSTKHANIAILLLFACFVMAVGVLSTRSRSGAAILILAIALFCLGAKRRRASRPQRSAMIAAAVLLVTIAFRTMGAGVSARFDDMTTSYVDRLSAWHDSSQILKDFWLSGAGLNTYGTAMLHYQTAAPERNQVYFEAHNDYLQIAVEGGLLLGIPLLILATAQTAAVRQRFQQKADDTRTEFVRFGAVLGVIAIAAQSFVEFTLQLPGAAVMFVALLAIAAHEPVLARRTG